MAYPKLNKIIKKGTKINEPKNLLDLLSKFFSDVYNENIAREIYFLSLYYGIIDPAMTLEKIGQNEQQHLTRERVRQIIDSILNKIKDKETKEYSNPFQKTPIVFQKEIGDNKFIRVEKLLKNDFFSNFKKNIKGLISFLNDCGIRQISYRKKYYFYPSNFARKEVIQFIQQENKCLRRDKTIVNMSQKSKTVTYVPDEVREFLLTYATKNKSHLNPLYESILIEYIKNKPYVSEGYVFSKTKSWKARKGKAQWQQIGIYIDKSLFLEIKNTILNIKDNLKKNVSLMGFICQSFVWYYEKNK